MHPLVVEPSGKPSDLLLPPFRPAPDLASTTTLPSLQEVNLSQKGQPMSDEYLARDSMDRPSHAEEAPISKDPQDSEVKDTTSSSRFLPVLAKTPTKKRTPLPDSSNCRKRPRTSDEGDVEADPDVRVPKRTCQGRTAPDKDVDWSLDENKDTKPPHPYVEMTKMAILSTPEKTLSMDGIYEFIARNYAYYRLMQDTTAWKKSVYGALRCNKAFEKVGKSTVLGAQMWEVKTVCRVNNVRRPKINQFQVRFAAPYTWSNPPP